jgi:hypothetical protein
VNTNVHPGPSSFEELDKFPLCLCPIDLRKLNFAFVEIGGLDLMNRFSKLRDFFGEQEWVEEKASYEALINKCEWVKAERAKPKKVVQRKRATKKKATGKANSKQASEDQKVKGRTKSEGNQARRKKNEENKEDNEREQQEKKKENKERRKPQKKSKKKNSVAPSPSPELKDEEETNLQARNKEQPQCHKSFPPSLPENSTVPGLLLEFEQQEPELVDFHPILFAIPDPPLNPSPPLPKERKDSLPRDSQKVSLEEQMEANSGHNREPKNLQTQKRKIQVEEKEQSPNKRPKLTESQEPEVKQEERVIEIEDSSEAENLAVERNGRDLNLQQENILPLPENARAAEPDHQELLEWLRTGGLESHLIKFVELEFDDLSCFFALRREEEFKELKAELGFKLGKEVKLADMIVELHYANNCLKRKCYFCKPT